MARVSLLYGLFAVISTLVHWTNALHASEAGIVDWHKPQIGVPHTHSHSLSPTFHRFSTGISKKSTQSIVITATQSNVLAALDAVSGELSWRYIYDASDPIISFRALGNTVVALSGPGGATLRTFDLTNGDLVAETRLHHPSAGQLFDPSDLGAHVTFVEKNDTTLAPAADIFTLTNGHIVNRVDTFSGKLRWSRTAEESLASVVYSRIARTPTTVYVTGLTMTGSSYGLHVMALSASSGEVLSSKSIPSAIHNGLTDFLLLSDISDDETNPSIVWLEGSDLKFILLTPGLDEKPKVMKGAAVKGILNIGLNERGHFVALRKDGTGLAMRLDKNSRGLSLIWEFAESASSKRYTESIYTGGLDKDGKPYVGRVYWSHILKTASVHIFAEHAAEGKGLIRGYTFPFETEAHGIITHAALDAANPSEHVIIGRLVLTSATGVVQLWQHDREQWTREEGLSEIAVAGFVELPEAESSTSHIDNDESFSTRLARQISDAKDFPTYATNFVKRFMTGSYASVSTSAAADNGTIAARVRDTFGFRQLIIAATNRGVVYAISAGDGTVVWRRILSFGWAASVGARHVPLKLFVTQTVSDGESPKVVLITQRLADNGLVDTVAFHMYALTGEDVEGKSTSNGLLEGVDVVNGEVSDVFLSRGEDKTVVLIDKFLQVYLFPESERSKAEFLKNAPKIHFPLLSSGNIIGHRVQSELSFTGRHLAYSTWATTFPPGETVVKTIKANAEEPVASFGKVLGDRSTLYKYLNPGLIGVVTTSLGAAGSNAASTCGIYLVDGLKGTIIYHASIASVQGSCDVHASLTENWFIYSYYDEDVSSTSQAKGWRAVSVELYEGNQVNDKTKKSESSMYYNRTADVSVYEQTFVFPTAINALVTTTTKHGIATKDLIVANHRNQIQTFPRRIFDPRRPNRKVTSEEQEEWLIQYDPLIPDDPRRIISHNYKVANTRSIITSPTLLESTSLVFAYGLDLFVSRLAPSHTFDVLNENFNKAQLVLTIVGLSVAIIITRPIVRRKKLREQWY